VIKYQNVEDIFLN